jgi:hypothetical protein
MNDNPLEAAAGSLRPDEATVGAVHRIAALVAASTEPGADATALGTAEAIRDVARKALRELEVTFARQAPVLRKVLEHGVPVPVLSVSKANHLETPWTQYLAHVCDPRASSTLGRAVGPRIFQHLSGRAVNPRDLTILSEVWLGRTCKFCDHVSKIDLLLIGPTDVVAIEQKVKSRQNHWSCSENRPRHAQLEEYSTGLKNWIGANRTRHFAGTPHPTLHKRYLTRSAAPTPEGWVQITHGELARAVLAAAPAVTRRADRHSLAAMLLDWNSEPFGVWPSILEELNTLVNSALDRGPRPEDLLRYGAICVEHGDLIQFISTVLEVA